MSAGTNLRAGTPAGRPHRDRPIAAARHVPAAVVAVLTVAALAEALPHAAQDPTTASSLAVGLLAGSLLALGTTFPAAVLEPAPAAVAVVTAAVLSLTGFHC